MSTASDTRATDSIPLTVEEGRLQEARSGVPWRAWGPYLSERQWGTVREDYSDGGDAWSYFSHDQARSRAYRWGEDGLAGISDDKQRLCLALALWNERDPILKERLFGLTNAEGNHGEDVKEYYFYVDNVPTHSYQRWLYKYPQAEFPYNELVAVQPEPGRARSSSMSSSTPASSTRTGISMSRWSTRRPHPRTSSAGSRCTTAHRRTRRCMCCRRCGFVTPGRGWLESPSLASLVSNPSIRSSGPSITSSACSIFMPNRKRPSCSARTRRTRPASGAANRRLAFPRMESVSTSCTAPTRSTLTAKERRRRHTSASRCPRAGLPAWSCASAARARSELTAPFADADRADRAATSRGRRVLRGDHAARRSRTTPRR